MKAKSFTLIELLVVVAVISLLIAILLPSLQTAREDARKAYCLNNIHQMLIAASTYTTVHNGRFFPAVMLKSDWSIEWGWDFTIYWDNSQPVQPGWLWMGQSVDKVHRCPSFNGDKNWGHPYTGYNYNTSFLGRDAMDDHYKLIYSPARIDEIADPAQCGVFGDGEFKNGPNNYMRSPKPSPYDTPQTRGLAPYGTQGYRHNHQTNVGWADGHVKSFQSRHDGGYPKKVPPHCGFLSEDNRLYDLE